MATDATGAVTSPDNIPTYNTAADAPSGKGLNAIVAAIQAALSTRLSAATITTNGDLIYGTGAGTIARLGIGGSGQVLTVAGGIPTWATPSGGFTTIYDSGILVAGAATLDTGVISTAGYSKIIIDFRGRSTNASNVASQLRLNADSGSNYKYATNWLTSSTAVGQGAAIPATDTYLNWDAGTTPGTGGPSGSFIVAEIVLLNPGDASKTHALWHAFVDTNSTTANTYNLVGGGRHDTAAAVTRIQMTCGGGSNFDVGSRMIVRGIV